MWAERSLEIHEGVLSPEDFVPVRNQMKLPYKHGIFNAQYFGADLLCHGGESYSLLIHGTHAIFDGQVTLDTTQCLFRSLTAPDSEPSVIQLAWGTEWKHLAAGIVAAMGGAPKGWKEGVPALSQTFQEIVQNPVVMFLSLVCLAGAHKPVTAVTGIASCAPGDSCSRPTCSRAARRQRRDVQQTPQKAPGARLHCDCFV